MSTDLVYNALLPTLRRAFDMILRRVVGVRSVGSKARQRGLVKRGSPREATNFSEESNSVRMAGDILAVSTTRRQYKADD